jgi:hypothetical protein
VSGQIHVPARIENEIPPVRSLFVFINVGTIEKSTHKQQPTPFKVREIPRLCLDKGTKMWER